jgi:hypothetical protein
MTQHPVTSSKKISEDIVTSEDQTTDYAFLLQNLVTEI